MELLNAVPWDIVIDIVLVAALGATGYQSVARKALLKTIEGLIDNDDSDKVTNAKIKRKIQSKS